MIAFHAQGKENDTIWLNSKLEPYKFNRAILKILGQTRLRTQECEVGVPKVMYLVWERKQSCEMGTENEREGAQEHYGGEIEASRAIGVVIRTHKGGGGG